MRESVGNLWDHIHTNAVICITTNGVINRHWANIMGKGCAKEAKDRYPWLPHKIGGLIKAYGNVCQRIPMGLNGGPGSDWTLITFPTKNHWSEDSDPFLIIRSAEQLEVMADTHGWEEVVMPRPGAGNGRLDWESVRQSLDPILDDRFLVLHK
jgi:hypothetical protein